MPVSCRIDGLTKMIYAIVMNVVTPASSSVFQFVPSAVNSKYRSARSTRGIEGFYRVGADLHASCTPRVWKCQNREIQSIGYLKEAAQAAIKGKHVREEDAFSKP